MIHKFNPSKIKKLNKLNRILKLFFHTKKERLPIDIHHVQRILIIDPTLIGDIVMLIPFLRIIKTNLPEVEITLICGEWGRQILQYQNLIDQFIIIKKGILNSGMYAIKNINHIVRTIRLTNSKWYDLALEPRGDLRYIFFMYFCNSKRKISYNYTGGESLLTDVIIPSEYVEHLVEDKLYFLNKIGFHFDKNDIFPKLYLTERQREENKRFKKDNGLEYKKIIGMHPGASLQIKQWFGFSRLLECLVEARENLAFFIFEGPGENEEADKLVKAGLRCKAQMFYVKTDIEHYMQKLALCDAVICNDSGAGHIAAAYGVETFVIFGPVLPALARPYKNTGVHIFSNDAYDCKPCLSSFCKFGNKCMNGISVNEVFNSVNTFLR